MDYESRFKIGNYPSRQFIRNQRKAYLTMFPMKVTKCSNSSLTTNQIQEVVPRSMWFTSAFYLHWDRVEFLTSFMSWFWLQKFTRIGSGSQKRRGIINFLIFYGKIGKFVYGIHLQRPDINDEPNQVDTNNIEERKTILSFFLIIKNIENEQF